MTRWFCLLLRRRNRITNMATSPKIVHDGAIIVWMSKEMLVFHYLSLAVIGAKNVVPHSQPIRGKDEATWPSGKRFPALRAGFSVFFASRLTRLESLNISDVNATSSSPKKRAARALVDLLPVLGTKQCKLGFLQPKREVYFRQREHSTKSCSFSAFLQRRAKRSICCLPCQHHHFLNRAKLLESI